MTVGWAAMTGWRHVDDGLRVPNALDLLLTELPEHTGSFKESRLTSTCSSVVVKIKSVSTDVFGTVTETDDWHRVIRFGSSDAEPAESEGGTVELVALVRAASGADDL